VTDSGEGTLTRVDASGSGKSDELRLGGGASAVAYARGAVWVLVPGRGAVARVDPGALRVADEIPVGGTPRDIAASGRDVWVSVAAARAVPARVCTPLEGSPDDGDVTVVVDLPLRMGAGTQVPAMTRAIGEVMEQHGHRAGRFSISTLICDDSSSRHESGDPEKCAANARAYADDAAIVGVVGPLSTTCAAEQLRPAAHAPGGPLAIVSPTSTFIGITQSLRRGDRGALFRVTARDDRQAAAAARFLYAQGHRRAYVLDDYEPYGLGTAGGFQNEARRIGLRVVGRRSWREHEDLGALTARVLRARPDVVWVGGALSTDVGRVVRAFRGRVQIAGPEGFLPVSKLFHEAGAAARGALFVTGMPPGGRDVPAADSAADATEVVLDAVARSDGTRASVSRAIRDSGRFDEYGDAIDAPIAIMRAERGGGSAMVMSTDGATVVTRVPGR
jgi:ABC-type branched-subunit amino acid transport system substrate-binding protein